MMQYSIEPRTRKYVKGYGFLSFERKYKKELLDITGNKNADAVTKSNDDKIVKQKYVEEIIIPPQKREEIEKTNWEEYYKNRTLKNV